jgi:hypothetical protein
MLVAAAVAVAAAAVAAVVHDDTVYVRVQFCILLQNVRCSTTAVLRSARTSAYSSSLL